MEKATQPLLVLVIATLVALAANVIWGGEVAPIEYAITEHVHPTAVCPDDVIELPNEIVVSQAPVTVLAMQSLWDSTRGQRAKLADGSPVADRMFESTFPENGRFAISSNRLVPDLPPGDYVSAGSIGRVGSTERSYILVYFTVGEGCE